MNLEPLHDYIANRLSEPVRLVELAEYSGYSAFYLIRLFKKHFRLTPHQYQVKLRIERAKNLLAASALSVTDICFEIGFESLTTFSARFKEIVGWAPSAYRARVFAQAAEPLRFIPHCYIYKYGLRPLSK